MIIIYHPVCITVSIISLVLYVRYRKRNARYLTLSAEVSGHEEELIDPVCGNETTSLIENQEEISKTPNLTGSINGIFVIFLFNVIM